MIDVKELCIQYYTYVVYKEPSDYDQYIDILTRIADQDSSFREVVLKDDKELIKKLIYEELLALKIELFGLAFITYVAELDENKKKELNIDALYCTEITFTKRLLETQGKANVWHATSAYNNAMRRAIYGNNPIFSGSNRKFNDYTLQGLRKFTNDDDCARRVINRMEGSLHWKDGLISKGLTFEFTDRMGCQLNIKALFEIEIIIYQLFKNAKNFIESIDYYGSYKNYISASDNLKKE